ncbi:AAA family ATPase [Methylocystis suflitae]|uniref:AAA family ATPase n=1 Tax=Methylocystis suflitae TaxID=2951405 RepID=UPI00210916A1|nr:AAA family ATPase [Methylocystis suflitae]MCQ4188250.1 AAA family ATPase [Methylocystis suflitae]
MTLRILAIRGAHLASLAEGFAIDFDSEPLRSAGLFAITGETGAGKSTILDAICLALYDKFPRVVAAGASEGAPDPSGETLGAGDPRAILRRGAGRGFAEVDFIGKDGLRYRARCDLQRARGRASGALQKRVRSLWRIDEAGEVVAPVESGIEPVNARVVELTDLTFDQFRRTALLAQGEFDAFLRADAKERAELLEKITGAEIYGVLSQRAFERAREAQQATALIESSCAQIGVMSEDERAAIDADIAATEAERAQVAERRSAMADALRRFDALAQAHAKLAQAMSAREGALRAFDEMTPRRETLAALAQVEPLRVPRDEMRRAEETQKAAFEEAVDAKAKASAEQEAFADQEARARSAAEEVAASEAEITRFAPIWSEAAALDARIANLAQEEAKARSVAQDAASRAQAKRDERAETMERRADIEREKETALADLARLEPARALSERWRDIDDWLTKRAEISQARRECDRALAAAFADIDRGDATLADFNARDAQDRAACEKFAAQIADRDGALLTLDEPAALARADVLARAVELIEALRRCARTFDEANVAAASAHQDIARYAQDEAAIRQKLEGLRSERARQAAQSAEAERFGELADAAADPHALRLRAALNDDAPCPVCGAREHPFAETHDAARALIEALRARRDESRRSLSRLDEEIVSLSEPAAQAHALYDDASRRSAQAQSARARAEAEYASLLSADCARDMAPELAPPTSIVSASPRLQLLAKELATARDGVAQKLLAARRLREERDRLRAEGDAIRQGLDARQEERAALAASLEVLREARARAKAEGEGLVERLESLDRSLAPYLQLCNLSATDLDRDGASARRRLETAGAKYQEALARSDEVAANLAAISLKAERIAAEADSACAREAEAKGDHEARARSLTEARDARALLLEGEATAAHRSRVEVRHRAAIAARDEARQRLAEAQQSKTACETRHAHCASAAESAAARAAQARTAFAVALVGAGFDEATAAPLLAMSREEQAELRRVVQAAEAERAAAEAAVRARQGDFDEAQAVAPTEVSREQLAAEERSIAGRLDDLSARLGAMRERRARDDEARERATALADELERARINAKIWSEISEAIGSASGDKFRRFAQAATLQHLVALANQRLALLAPRYALERSGDAGSLGLQIIDRDLGDERRSTRSLSGGERFLASLALALALAGLEGRDSFVDTLFIDEGFGALDSTTLDVVIDALETLQGQGRRVGVISHVDSLQQRIATKICVERRGGGVSVVRLRAPNYA